MMHHLTTQHQWLSRKLDRVKNSAWKMARIPHEDDEIQFYNPNPETKPCQPMPHSLESSLATTVLLDDDDDSMVQDLALTLQTTYSTLRGHYSGPVEANRVPHGEGVLQLANGDVYQGPFCHGDMHGNGAVYTEWDGSVYRGEFQHNLRHGRGEWITLNRRYCGQFYLGKMHGQGTLYYLDGSIDFEGTWVYGEPRLIVEDGEKSTLVSILQDIMKTEEETINTQGPEESRDDHADRNKDDELVEDDDEGESIYQNHGMKEASMETLSWNDLVVASVQHYEQLERELFDVEAVVARRRIVQRNQLATLNA